MTTKLATMTEYSAPLDALDEYLIPTGAHWTLQGRDGSWVIRWNRVTGTVQARRWSHERGTGFSAVATDLPSARREARRIAKLISEGQTGDCRSCSRGEDGGGEPCDCPTACGARYCQHPEETIPATTKEN